MRNRADRARRRWRRAPRPDLPRDRRGPGGQRRGGAGRHHHRCHPEQVLADRSRRFDKGGEQFYDQISALHKCVRSPTRTPRCTGWRACSTAAAIRATCAATDADGGRGHRPRRSARAADGDRSLGHAYDRLGRPKAISALAQLAIYPASTAKSNAAYTAFGEAKRDVAEYGTQDVPMHMRNAPTN